jgi:hypothetical protein
MSQVQKGEKDRKREKEGLAVSVKIGPELEEPSPYRIEKLPPI